MITRKCRWWMEYCNYDTGVIVRMVSPVIKCELLSDSMKRAGRTQRGHLRARIIAAFRLMTNRPRLTWGDLIEAGDFDGGLEFLD